MRKWILTIIMLTTLSCQEHIVVPLTGVAIGRPYTATSDFGARVGTGAATAPLVQGVVDEVHNPDGDVINPIPGENIIDPITGETSKAGFSLSENKYTLLPVMDIAATYKNVELGYSTLRGTYILWDFINQEHYTVSYSPSYSTFEETGSAAPDGSVSNVEGEVDMEAMSQNINNTLLGSVRTGTEWWGQMAFYGGVGLNMFKVSVEDKRTAEKRQQQSTATSAIAGVYFKLLIFEATYEVQQTTIKNRNGKSDQVNTNYSSAGLNISF